ncbi:hypothetical protein C6A87_016500 [Mycobacterium sp. ITM-2016-00317]|nr:hypothetical protein [Mycobacterium sp. ITM-2016-00317]WNG85548.1 hypothetical protein C6A87_016500 [Mycobacterium sp. ITM-2016-00317]
MTGARDRKYGTHLPDVMPTRVRVGDGATGIQLHAADRLHSVPPC